MALISGQVSTANSPNYTGNIINVSPLDTPFLSTIAGVTAQNFDGSIAGAVPTNSTIFQWQLEDLRDGADNRQKLEGANAPAAEGRSRANAINVLEIHQETLEVSYTALAASGQYAATGSANLNAQGLQGVDPAADEASRQDRVKWREIARDIEATFITGTINDAADGTAAARRTGGILEAITTNVTAAAGAALTEAMISQLMQDIWTAGGISNQETATIIVGGAKKRELSAIFVPSGTTPRTRTVGGVNLETIVTDFGELNVMLSRYIPATTVAVVSMEQCRPRILNIPGKGTGIFKEELAKTGSADRWQYYGEVGLEWGNQLAHGKLTGLA